MVSFLSTRKTKPRSHRECTNCNSAELQATWVIRSSSGSSSETNVMKKHQFKQLIKSIHRLITTKILSFSNWIHSSWLLRIAQFRSLVKWFMAYPITISAIASIRSQIQERFSIQRQEATRSILATNRIFSQANTPSRFWGQLVSQAQLASVKPRHSSQWQLSMLVTQVLLNSNRVPFTLPHTCLALLNWLNSLTWTTIWLGSRSLFGTNQLLMEKLFH